MVQRYSCNTDTLLQIDSVSIYHVYSVIHLSDFDCAPTFPSVLVACLSD